MQRAEVDAYMSTVNRIEPEIHPLDQGGALASIAVSLKRIADSLSFTQSPAFRAFVEEANKEMAKMVAESESRRKP